MAPNSDQWQIKILEKCLLQLIKRNETLSCSVSLENSLLTDFFKIYYPCVST